MKSWIATAGLWAVVLAFLAACAAPQAGREADQPPAPRGSYQLVGVGPGDGDLMTPRAVNALREADIIFSSPRALEKLSPYVSFEGKQVLDGYGSLFPFYGKKCSELTEEEKASERMSCEEYHQKQAEFATMVLFTMRTEFRKFIDSLSRHYQPTTPVAIVSSAG